MELYTICPKLISVNREGTLYRGFITAEKQDFLIEIKFDKAGDLGSCQLDGEWKLYELLRQHQTIISQRLNHCGSLAAFMLELKSILESELRSRRQSSQLVPLPQFYTGLISAIESLGWSRVSFIDSTFRELHIVCVDMKQRKHILKLHLHEQHPDKSPTFASECPLPFDILWTPQTSLVDVYEKFEKCVQQWQEFWDMVDDIDGSTCVLEPEKPKRNATYRRIVIGKNASINITIDPSQPRVIPDCQFLGADHVVGPLKENFAKNWSLWKLEASLRINLQSVLEIEFPSPRTANKQDFSSECGICYAYRLGEEIPDQSCDDSRCSQTFHNSCLCEWLRALPSTRQSFNVLFGECPYCGKSITVKIQPH